MYYIPYWSDESYKNILQQFINCGVNLFGLYELVSSQTVRHVFYFYN